MAVKEDFKVKNLESSSSTGAERRLTSLLEKSPKAVDEIVGAEEEDGAERKGERGGNSSTWPTLALKPSKTGKKKEGDRSGHASSVEEGKENQVFPLFLPFMNGI